MAVQGSSSVHDMAQSLEDLLEEAVNGEITYGIDHALTEPDLNRLIQRINALPLASLGQQFQGDSTRQTLFARIETAVRNVFNSSLASTSIDDPAFAKVWILLDVVSIISDQERCEPGLIFWLVEELLDSQTIEGCRKVFDYLESRRERITAKHFKQKNLIILRSCNELLRRLSRAENTVFCGRVFIFLFQSFPLGDKSSVNLRGEYHAENVTAFEQLDPKPQTPAAEEMDLDVEKRVTETTDMANEENDANIQASAEVAAASGEEGKSAVVAVVGTEEQPEPSTNGPQAETSTVPASKAPDYDTLYPIFWSLQEHFSNPTSLFDHGKLEHFRSGLAQTMSKFKEVQQVDDSRNNSKTSDDSKRGVKRKRGDGPEYIGGNFHPKYLTSRDLFELEMMDLSFRRHICVQTLILVDFLLSLAPQAKAKLADLNNPNKSVQYQYTLSDEHAKWATDVKTDIASYLARGQEGKFYYRMVDTILSRDKNWVRWKAESCPAIELAPISAQDWADAQDSAERVCAVSKHRDLTVGTLDLTFLSEEYIASGLDDLKHPRHYTVPEVESFHERIVEADEKIREAVDEEAKEAAVDVKSSLMWRSLRLAMKDRLKMFDKLENFVQDLTPIYRAGRPEDQPLVNGVEVASASMVTDEEWRV
ncbi:MAG: hypothetical protein M1816_000939 [Peltula sp. TS41687]|nr:MAG: hypothetical protein M1816_000939 [Peltula sp. TS41687]